MVTRVLFAKSDLLRACRQGNADFLRTFVEEHQFEKYYAIIDENGWGPLHYAVDSDSAECVEILLSTGLVDIRSTTQSWKLDHLTCIDIAIRKASSNILRLLLQNDPNFYLIEKLCYRRMTTDMVEVLMDTLEKMSFPFTFGFITSIAEILPFKTDTEKVNSFRIFEKLVGLVADEKSNSFMQDMCNALLRCPYETREHLFEWCVQRYHLTEANQHRELVRRLLENPDFGFNHHIIFGLHSQINSIGFSGNSTISPIYFFDKIFDCLLKIDVSNRDIVKEVTSMIWPKVNNRQFNNAFYFTLRENEDKQRIYNKITSIEWLDITKIGEKIEIDMTRFSNWTETKQMLGVFMPFSTEITADVYLAARREQLNDIKADMKEHILQAANHQLRRFGNERAAEWSEAFQHNCTAITEELRKLDDDDLEKYCVEGAFRVKSTLKSLCRAKIRKSLLRPKLNGVKKSHSELVENIRCLELPKTFQKYSKSKTLPKSIQRFLLFNYSDYDF